jgi:hypothetical protein
MDPLENSLSTLRRTHFALFIAAGAVLVLVAPSGPDYESALEELRVLREVSGPSGYLGYCASVAHEVYSSQWDAVLRVGDRTHGSEVPFADDIEISGVVHCSIPEADAPLESFADFFLNDHWAWSAGIDTLELAQELLELAERVALETGHEPPHELWISRVRVLAVDDDSIPLSEAFQARDTFRMQFTDRPTLMSLDSVIIGTTLTLDGGSSTIGTRFTSAIAGFQAISPGGRPFDWLATTTWGDEALSTSRDGQITVFPSLQPFWEQISTYSLDEAARYLQLRAEQQQGNVEILGMQLRTDLVAWAGPFVLLILLIHLFVHLQHLRPIAHTDPDAIRVYPWIALFEGGLSVALVFLSLVLLPSLAATAVSARMARSSPASSFWAAGVAVACLVIGYRAFVELRSLKPDDRGTIE